GDGLRQQRRALEVMAQRRHVKFARLAGREIALVSVHRFGERLGAARVDTIAAACKSSGAILRLKEVEHVLAVSVLVIVGKSERLGPFAALAVSDANDPSARTIAAAIPERDPGRDDREVVRLLARLETQASGARFEPEIP